MEPAGNSWQGAARPSGPPRCDGAAKPGERAEPVTLLVWPTVGQSKGRPRPRARALKLKVGASMCL